MLHLVYASRRYLPLRTRTFLQFMEQRIPELPGFHATTAPTVPQPRPHRGGC